ncbi:MULTISPECIES: carbon storage regulator CsrA [Paenibacillus]|jgi:carbon storage regulator|uniref:Translational regulator CsrA n=2 Tax=Paenibacillus TaxID=44249 RepID=A0ABX2ZF14_PAEPO|nr:MULTISPECIES: carbon storage regulator CsrA [Paenibacillus]ALA44204.1 carbon storage regulator [Paenibacillus peoriae]APB73994.1 carbon storage regulator [Paenibacillus polymyxa]APQ61500.1 carbon storage regulator [Paenibacillus polymyxa]MCP3745893.1 carbon storage regulator CsrA [Paenibacillus sp. A3M_27_13]MDR6778877.1 carbon storage regulator [Paenibacillus peoriae]
MLVLTRKKGESIVIQNDIVITVLSVEGDTVKIGISAPKDIDIYRKEVFDAIQQNNQIAVMDSNAIHNAMLEMDKRKS